MHNLYRLLEKYVSPGNPPSELDLPFYRLIHDDLAEMNDETLKSHFHLYGRSEGRMASAAAHRLGLISLVPVNKRLLEIGPFTKPVFRGRWVNYFDVLDRAALVERAREHGHPTENCPIIDYVSPNGDLSIVPNGFNSVFSSHCIEHQPDFIDHLNAVERILKPGGRYYMMVPDKRFCFDSLLTESKVDDIIEAHIERRKVHTYRSVYEHIALTTHNDAVRHWSGDSEDPNAHLHDEREAQARAKYEQANGSYIDVHAWQFTPESLRKIISTLNARGLVRLRPERIYDTIYGSVEFSVILRKWR